MRNLLRALFHSPGIDGRWGLPVIFRGAPGVGKTSILRQAAGALGLHVETVLASLRQPEDFLGLPIPAHDEATREQLTAWMRDALPNAEPTRRTAGTVTFTAVTYAPPRWAVRLALAGRGVCFLDEVNSAPPAVQAALLRVVLEGVVGDLTLPRGIRFAAAMNPTEEAAGGWDLAAPLANRFGHLPWPTPEVADWAEYMIGQGGGAGPRPSPEDEEDHAMASWPKHYPQAIGTVSAFLRARRDLFLAQPKAGDPKASEAWPSPRSWHMATHALAAGTLHNLPQIEAEQLVSAFVGAGPANELATFKEKLDLPDPEQLLDGRVTWAHNPNRLDRTAAVLSSCSAFLVQHGPKAKPAKDRTEKLWTILDGVAKDAVDVCVPAVRAIANGGFATGTPSAVRVLNRAYSVVDAAQGGRS